MTAKRIRLQLSTVAGSAIALFALPLSLWAGALDVSPYLEYGAEYDSNLFQRADDDGKRADTVQHATIGVLAEWPASRQHFEFGAEATEYRYNRFDQIDHSQNLIHGTWNYMVGSIFYGVLSYREQRRLADFSDRENSQPDFIQRNEPQLDAYLEITPNWRVHTRAGYLRLDHSLDSETRFNRRETLGVAEIQYTGSPGSLIGTGVEVVDGRYPEREQDDSLSRRFSQTTGFVESEWKYSDLSAFRARLGYTQRDNGDSSDNNDGDRDFSGVTGRLGYERKFSGKTRASVDFFRQIYSVNQVDANYVRDTGARLKLIWTYSPMLDLTAQLSRSRREYQALFDSNERRDTVDEFVAEMVWQPYRALALIVNASAIQRDSNEPDESYDEWIGGAAVRLTLDGGALY